MWFIIVITILNAVANNSSFLDYRYEGFGLPINALDILLILGLIFVVVLPRGRRMPVPAVHPAYKWILGLFVGGAMCGFIGCLNNGANSREIITASRNFLAMPASIIIGYGLLHNMRGAKIFPYVHVLGGIISALMVLLFFKDQGDNTAAANNINLLRTIEYVTSYAGTAAAFLIFLIIGNINWIPKFAALAIAAFCILGQFATLSRSEWIATAFAVFRGFRYLPRGTRLRAAIKTIFVTLIMTIVLAIGVQAASSMLGWDFATKMQNKILSMLPGVTVDVQGKEEAKAWATRLPGAFRELEIYTQHPIFGAGFAATAVEERMTGLAMGFNHNAWTAVLCQTGLIGFFAYVLTVGSCIVVGRRMINDRYDMTTTVIGALGAMTGVFFIIYGLSTMSFNILRPAIPLGIVCGVVLRTRVMQLSLMQSQQQTVGFDVVQDEPTGFEALSPGLATDHW